MKQKTVKTKPLKSKTIVLHIEKPVVRKRFAPHQRVHGTKKPKRNSIWMKEIEALDSWCG